MLFEIYGGSDELEDGDGEVRHPSFPPAVATIRLRLGGANSEVVKV
jgi:hypothetical protein